MRAFDRTARVLPPLPAATTEAVIGSRTRPTSWQALSELAVAEPRDAVECGRRSLASAGRERKHLGDSQAPPTGAARPVEGNLT